MASILMEIINRLIFTIIILLNFTKNDDCLIKTITFYLKPVTSAAILKAERRSQA